MSVLTITSGLYSNVDEIVNNLSEKLNSKLITDSEIIENTNQTYDIKLARLQKIVESKQIPFNDFTHEREKGTALLKKTIANFLAQGPCIFNGNLGQLIPKNISHVMRVLIIANKKQRVENGMKNFGLSEKEVIKNIETSDKSLFLLTNSLFGKKAWDESLYDIVIPTDKLNSDESAALILKYLKKLSFNEELVENEILNFKLAVDVEVALTEIGKGLLVHAADGKVVVTIDKKVLMLAKFQQKIINTVQKIPGVQSVQTKIGKNFYEGNLIHNYNFDPPLRILLVDDEKEFVQTLSERLKMRSFASEIAYNGQEALDFTDQEDTEVILLDLKMPGIDGFEVLKKIKHNKPDIEVIILTGHGSEKDKKTCLELGAFAYLQKPADIDLITETMKKAYEKIEDRRSAII